MVYLTGDTHGELDRFKHGRLRWLGKRDIVVVLGDFGFVWDGSKEEQKKLSTAKEEPKKLSTAKRAQKKLATVKEELKKLTAPKEENDKNAQD